MIEKSFHVLGVIQLSHWNSLLKNWRCSYDKTKFPLAEGSAHGKAQLVVGNNCEMIAEFCYLICIFQSNCA